MAVRHLINGQLYSAVDCRDRGLAYGDGVFTTVAVQNRKPCLWDLHCRRLKRDCRQLGIAFVAWRELQREVDVLAAAQTSATVKVIITRGAGKRGYKPPPDNESRPTRLVILHPQKLSLFDPRREAAAITVCRHRLPHTPVLAGAKHLNRLDQVLARQEWDNEYADGLMLDQDGAVIEGTMSNVFIYHKDRLLTPSLDACGVKGVMRQYALDQATAQGLGWDEKSLRLEDFHKAEGAFLCNAAIGLWPIKRLAQQTLPLSAALESFMRRTMEALRIECRESADAGGATQHNTMEALRIECRES